MTSFNIYKLVLIYIPSIILLAFRQTMYHFSQKKKKKKQHMQTEPNCIISTTKEESGTKWFCCSFVVQTIYSNKSSNWSDYIPLTCTAFLGKALQRIVNVLPILSRLCIQKWVWILQGIVIWFIGGIPNLDLAIEFVFAIYQVLDLTAS